MPSLWAVIISGHLLKNNVWDVWGHWSCWSSGSICGESAKQHDNWLMQVLKRARKWNLKLNKHKCQIKKHKINYIGYILTKDGLRPDPMKTNAIMKMPLPENREELQTFLVRMLTYLNNSSFPCYSTTTSPVGKGHWMTFWGWSNEELYGTEETSYGSPVKYFNQIRSLSMPAPKVWVQFY